jgi:hypothetical protein
MPVLLLVGVAFGQEPALRMRYKEALERANAKDYARAYDMVFKVVRENEFYYEAQVLRIALATLLDKTGGESPQNLIRVASDYAPLGSNLQADVQRMVNLLRGTPVVESGGAQTGAGRQEINVSPYVRKKLALVIGIGAFKDPRINPLRFAANDARVFANTLKDECGFDYVQTLINEKATTIEIKNEIDNLAKAATAEDLAVVYFASHGSPEESDKAGINYVVTYDTDVDKLYATAFKMDDLLSDVKRRIPAERIVAFLDTCYSGGTFRELPSGWVKSRGMVVKPSGLQAESIEKDLRKDNRGIRIKPPVSNEARKPQGVGRVIIAASSQNEPSYEFAEDKGIQHGYFTYFLLDILRQKRAISVEELYDHLSDKVPDAVRRDTNGKQQHPTMVKSTEGKTDIYLRDTL